MAHRWTALCLVVLAVACVSLTGVTSDVAVAQSTTPTETGNDSVQHERPEEVGESGDLQELQRWLGGRLGDRLSSSTVALSEGQYEQARAVLGEEYDGRLAQYVDVAGETGTGEDAGETYDAVGDDQRNFTSQLQRFEQAQERYQSARDEGDTDEARAAAREMNRVAEEVADTGTDLRGGYDRLENQTGTETDAQREIIRNVTGNVTENAAEARRVTFVETELTILEATREISPAEPMQVSARLATANGSALSNRTVTVAVADRARSVTTDNDGRFEVTYRPRTLSLNASTVTVTYRPRTASAYLAANASVPVTVTQVSPTLTVENATAETRYGGPAGGNVVVTVEGEPVEDVPVVATLGGTELGTATTDVRGRARIDGTLPADVAPGNQSLSFSTTLRERALGPANDSAAVDVLSTPTDLTVEGDSQDGNVTVTGELRTDDGRSVGRRTIRITRNDSAVATVRADADGNFSATIPAGSASVGSTVQVGARFDGAGTNLESARVTTTVRITAAGDGANGGAEAGSGFMDRLADDRVWPIAGAGLLGVLVGLALLVRRLRGDDSGETDESPTGTAAPPPPPAGEREEGGPTPLERAESFLDRGASGAAVRTAYAGVRDRLLGSESTSTHWELLDRVSDLGDDERSALEAVVTAYERAAFAPSGIDADDAAAAIEAARSILGDDGDDGVEPADD